MKIKIPPSAQKFNSMASGVDTKTTYLGVNWCKTHVIEGELAINLMK